MIFDHESGFLIMKECIMVFFKWCILVLVWWCL